MTIYEINIVSAGRSLDAMIHKSIFGYEDIDLYEAVWQENRPGKYPGTPDDWVKDSVPHYSTEIGAAFKVVDKIKESPIWDYFTLGTDDGDGWHCRNYPIRNPGTISASGETPALAICRAALKAGDK